MPNKYIGHGSTLSYDMAGGTSWVAVVQVLSQGALAPELTSVDVTTLDSSNNSKDFKPGLKDSGTFNFKVMWDGNTATHQALTTAYTNRTTANWKHVGPDTKSTIFMAFITSYNVDEVTSEGQYTASISLKGTGDITWPS